MIDANEAKRRTLINCELKDLMNRIEGHIEKSIKDGNYRTCITLTKSLNKEFVSALYEEFTNLGYKITYEPAKQIPAGCPSDQWDFNSYLKIDWSLEKGETE